MKDIGGQILDVIFYELWIIEIRDENYIFFFR